MDPKRWLTALCLGSLLVVGGWFRPAYGLSDEEIYRRMRFNFIIPGGRSLALGGAFIAEGDDATAAASNPAALHYVSRQGFFVEYRFTSYDDEVFHGGDRKAPEIQPGGQTYLSMALVDNADDTNSLGFLSYVVPFRIGERRVRVAFSRQVLLDLKSTLSDGPRQTKTTFINPTFPVSWVDPSGHLGPYTVSVTSTGGMDAEIVQYNLALSYSIGRDLSVGFTVSQANLDFRAAVKNTFHDPYPVLFPTNPRDYYASSHIAKDFLSRTLVDDSDSAFGYTVGIHWHPDSSFAGGYSPWRFGIVYRKGARLEVKEVVSFSASLEPDAPRTRRVVNNVLKIPDRYGAGVSYHVKHWVFALDVERIQYSDLMEGFVAGISGLTNPVMRETWGAGGKRPPRYTVDDANVYHAGLEYRFTSGGGWTHFFRAGYYNEPDTRIRMTHLELGSEASADPSVYLDAFRGGDEENHFTAGYAVTTPGGLEFHVAGDFGDTTTTFVVSTVYRFGRLR